MSKHQDGTLAPIHLQWDQYRKSPQWNLPKADVFGFHRATYPSVEAGDSRVNMVVLPAGQSSPEAVDETDLVLVGVDGEVEVSVGTRIFRLRQFDLVGIEAGTAYRYTNVGPGFASLATVFSGPRSERGDPALTGQPANPIDGGVVGMEWEEYRRGVTWTLPFAEQWGYHRGSYPHIKTLMLRGHTVCHPFGQSSPWHSIPRNLLFVQIEGEVTFTFRNRDWALKPYDLMMIPANTPYVYNNVGMTDAYFFDIGAGNIGGGKAVYYDGDPGWPVRKDAPTFKSRVGAHGSLELVK